MQTDPAALIAELRGLCAKATPGDWHISESGATIKATFCHQPEHGKAVYVPTRICFGYDGSAERRANDWSLIVAAVNNLEHLLYLIEAQAATIAKAREGLGGIRLYCNDTLSGPSDRRSDQKWFHAGVVEVRNRARDTLAQMDAPE